MTYGISWLYRGNVLKTVFWMLALARPGLGQSTGPAFPQHFNIRDLPALPEEFVVVQKHLTAEERKLRNLYIESDAWREVWAKSAGAWQRTGAADWQIHAWLNGMPGGPARFDVARHLPWAKGLGPVSEDTYTAAWNGLQSRYLLRTTGVPGNTKPWRIADITAGISAVVADGSLDSATGCAASTQLYDRWQSQSLSGWLNEEGVDARTMPFWKRAYAITVSSVAEDGRSYLRIHISMEGVRDDTVIVDPARGYALISCTILLPAADEASHDQALTFVEAAPGVWWPTEGYNEFTDTEGTRRRTHFRVLRVVANDPAFKGSIFTPIIPPGWIVHDKIDNQTYIMAASTTREIENDLNAAVDNAAAKSRGDVENSRGGDAPSR
jgi:hypothetical protein